MVSGEVTKVDCAYHLKTFFTLSRKAQLEEFERFELAEQYKIFICGNQVVHPPVMELAYPIARRGESAVPFIKDRLTETKDDPTVRDIVRIFAAMQSQGTYDVYADRELSMLVWDRIAAIKDPEWRRIVRRMFPNKSSN